MYQVAVYFPFGGLKQRLLGQVFLWGDVGNMASRGWLLAFGDMAVFPTHSAGRRPAARLRGMLIWRREAPPVQELEPSFPNKGPELSWSKLFVWMLGSVKD